MLFLLKILVHIYIVKIIYLPTQKTSQSQPIWNWWPIDMLFYFLYNKFNLLE